MNVNQIISKSYFIFIVSRNNFEFCYVIGKGGFGKVWKVKHKKTKKFYALKEMSKLKVLDKKSEKSINSEREFLSKLHNAFIVNMHYAFQDSENLYLVMDLMPGGDLRFHISRHKKFSEEQTRFFICGIIIALEYIHSNNVIHRDIKPENLVLDENGYVRLTDFGIAKENMPDNKSETSGTPGYMSPEVMKALNHSFPVDFFALGVIGYEFMKGERPYVGRNRKEIKEQILAKQVEIKLDDITEGWSKESADFINKALIRKPENRIGYKGINELKIHPWLKYYPWEMLYQKTLPSPFIPENKDNFDRRYCESSDVITEETKLRYEEILMDDIYKTAFKNFYYNTDEDNKTKNNNINNINKLKNRINNKNSVNSNSHKIIINQKNKIITEINNENNNISVNNNSNINSGSKNQNLKNSMKIIPSTTRNIIIKNHKKNGSVINYNKNYNNNINTNVGGNVSNNVIYINFNINDPNIAGNIYNNKNAPPKSDRVIKPYKKSAKNIYYQGNTTNNMSNNNSLIQKIGINIGNFMSPMNSVKKIKKKNNFGSGEKHLININKKIYIKNKDKKDILNNNNLINSSKSKDKTKIVKNNKNLYNSMKDIYDLKNKTLLKDFQDTNAKNLKKSEIISNIENMTSLNKSNKEIKINKKVDMSHSYSFKDSLENEQKKDISIIKENKNEKEQLNKSNNINNSNSLKKVFLKHHSPANNKKDNIINNNNNNSSSISNIIIDKTNKNSRAYINNYISKNNDLSVNKSKTFLNDKQQPLREIKEIKEIFKSNKLKNKEIKNGINYSNNKNKFNNNNNIDNNNNNQKNFFSNDISNIKINRNSDINLINSKNKNSSFDNLKGKDNLIKTINPNQNQNQLKDINVLNKTINPINKKMENKKVNHNDSTKIIFQKHNNNNGNKINFLSPDESKFKNKKNLIKQPKYPINNLSVSSTGIKGNKNKGISNSTLNINNIKNNDEEIKGYISVRNKEYNNENNKNIIGKIKEPHSKNIIFSYKQKPKSKIK